jgi:Flp pilus assembly protein TadG
MMKLRKSEKGQALVLIVFAIVGMLALVGLAMDGGQSFSDRRKAQNAADSAALAAALKYQRNTGHSLTDVENNAKSAATVNGYEDGVNGTTVTYNEDDDDTCPGGDGKLFTVTINSTVSTWFAPVVGVKEVKNTVTATTRACPAVWAPPFNGAAVVGLDPNGTSVTSGTSGAVKWKLKGGGIFANNDAFTKTGTSITFTPAGTCVEAVGTASNFGCTPVLQNQTAKKYNYPTDIIEMLPPIPTCTGTAYTGADGKVHVDSDAAKAATGSVVNDIDHDFAPGLYCVDIPSGMNTYSGCTQGVGVTLYIRSDGPFTVKYKAATGCVAIQAPTTGAYAGIAIFSHITPSSYNTPPTCTQNFEFRGQGAMNNKGTIFLPSACIDWRGTSSGDNMKSQLIGFQVSSNGDADVAINYDPDDNYNILQPNVLELVK